MAIQLNEESGGKILVVHVSGKVAKADYEHVVPEFERLLLQHGKLRVLFDMIGLHGWDAGAMWEDIKFDMRHFADIERLAMVGEKKWQHGMATFCKPFTKATIRYFDHADAAEARKWLGLRRGDQCVGGKARAKCKDAIQRIPRTTRNLRHSNGRRARGKAWKQ